MLTENEKKYMEVINEIDDLRTQLLYGNASDEARCKLLADIEKLTEFSNSIADCILADSADDSESYKLLCPNCLGILMHTECGQTAGLCGCECYDDEFFCVGCSLLLSWDDLCETPSGLDEQTLTEEPSPTPTMIGKQCSHLHQEVMFPSGVTVKCTSHYNATKMTEIPEFGLYADSCWVRTCIWRNETINWPDMSLPVDKHIALSQIKAAYDLAVSDIQIEVGCIGAHGRTGVILAIMYLLDTGGSDSSEVAVDWVREVYCPHAIETSRQEWFVNFAAGVLYDHEVAEEPIVQKTIGNYNGTTSTGCLPVEHLAMFDAGLQSCVRKKDCTWWEKDKIELYESKTINSTSVEELLRQSNYATLLARYKAVKGS